MNNFSSVYRVLGPPLAGMEFRSEWGMVVLFGA
jgi:hypothetical protein